MRRRVAETALAALPGTVIPYGIDPDAYVAAPHARDVLGWPAKAPLVLSVGSQYSRQDDRKGFSVLVEAFERFVTPQIPAARLVIVGTVHDPAVREGATVIPKIDSGELAVWYAAADVFALPSLGDNAPLAILEAMSASVPVVATTVGGIPEEVESGATGLLVPPRDPASLGAALVRLLRDRELRASFGAAGRARVVARFNRAHAWTAHEALYRSLASKPARSPSQSA
jgi:glycosyltransferase involved in cell wall biosynthesis